MGLPVVVNLLFNSECKICPAGVGQRGPPLGRCLHGVQGRGQGQREVPRPQRRHALHQQLHEGRMQRLDPYLGSKES